MEVGMKRLCECAAILAGVILFSQTSHGAPQAPPTPPAGLATGPATGQAGQPRQPQPPGKITGRVLRVDTGRPLPKASVTLAPEGRFSDVMTVRVDGNGAFEFSEVVPGRYRVSAERNGYVRQTYGQRGGGPGVVLEVQSKQVVDKIQFSLERGGVISGNVLDEDNEPVEGVDVRAMRVRFVPGGKQRTIALKTARTDDLGNYRLTGLSPGFYYVQAAGRGEFLNFSAVATGFSYAGNFYPGVMTREEAQRIQVAAAGETRRIDFSLREAKTYSVSGVVIDPQPASGPRNYSVGMARGGSTFFSAGVNEEGKFTLRGLEPGEHNVFALSIVSSQGLGTAQRRGYSKVTITDSDQHVVIELGKSAEVSGEVKLTGQGALPSRTFVQLQSENENAPNASAPVAEGKFEMKNVADGSFSFVANDPTNATYLTEARCGSEDYTMRKVELTLESKLLDCVLTLAADVGQVTATVTREGNPAEGSIVVFIVADEERRKNPRNTVLGQTAPNGTAQVRGIVPGDYIVYAMMPADDAPYYDPEFVARNRDTGTKVTIRPTDQQAIALKVITPK